MNTRDMVTLGAGFVAGVGTAALSWYMTREDERELSLKPRGVQKNVPKMKFLPVPDISLYDSDDDNTQHHEGPCVTNKLYCTLCRNCQTPENNSTCTCPHTLKLNCEEDKLSNGVLEKELNVPVDLLEVLDLPDDDVVVDMGQVQTRNTLNVGPVTSPIQSEEDIHLLGQMLVRGLGSECPQEERLTPVPPPASPPPASPPPASSPPPTTTSPRLVDGPSTTSEERLTTSGTEHTSSGNTITVNERSIRDIQCMANQLTPSLSAPPLIRSTSPGEQRAASTPPKVLPFSPFLESPSSSRVRTTSLASESEDELENIGYTSFPNLLSSLTLLEERLGPARSEDLNFLKDLIQSEAVNRLRARSAADQRRNFSPTSYHARGVMNEIINWSRPTSNGDVEELCSILSDVDVMATMSAHDQVARYDWEIVEEDSDNEMLTISFSKPDNESLGATIIQDRKSGEIKIKRIIEKSPIAICNKIHPGDQITRINGDSVADKTLDEICELLSMSSGDHCSLTIASAGTVMGTKVPPKSRFFRAFFNYEPLADTSNPCREASFSFELGDILEVLNTEDAFWWQAKKFNSQTVGLIPSPEQRIRYLNGQSKSDSTLVRVKTRPKRRARDFLFSITDGKGYKEPLTYVEVTHIKPSKNKRRPMIITGAKGFGGNCVRERLIEKYPGKYHMVVPHTTKPQAEGEIEGQTYYFCNKSEFDALIKGREMIEYTKLGGHYYGTSYQSVKDLINSGKICILNLHPQLLPLLCNGDIRPHVIFIESSSEERMKHLMEQQPNELPQCQRKFTGGEIRELRFNSERLLRRYTEFVDTIITLESLSSTVDLINRVVERVEGFPAWVPKAWLEPY